MKIEKLYQPVVIRLENEEDFTAVRDALFLSNNQIAIKVAKELNSLLPRKRGPVVGHKKERTEVSAKDQILEVIRNFPGVGSTELKKKLPGVNKKTISAALTIAHQKGLILRKKKDGVREYFYTVTTAGDPTQPDLRITS